MRNSRTTWLSAIVLSTFLLTPPLLASTVTVNTEDDTVVSENCSLRAAIQTTNTGSQVGGCVPSDGSTPDTITLPAGNYVLEGATSHEDNGIDGDLDITSSVTLNGAGAGTTVVDASGLDNNGERVFHVDPYSNGVTAVFNGITVTGGTDDEGGGILLQGASNFNVLSFGKAAAISPTGLTLNNVVVSENTSFGPGAGILNDSANLTINGSQITGNNSIFDDGGGIANESGGGIRVDNIKALIIGSIGVLEIHDTTISGNHANEVGGGISNEGSLEIDSSTLSGNDAGGVGGGLFGDFGTDNLITNSTISGNEATNVFTNDIKFEIFDTAGNGGGVFMDGPASFIMVNSTVSGNTAFGSGGGIFINEAFISAIQSVKLGIEVDQLGLFNVTVANNSAGDTGGGVLVYLPEEDEIPTKAGGFQPTMPFVANTIIADNSANVSPDCFGTYASFGYNIVEDTNNCVGFGETGDQIGIDPQLKELGNYGGTTQTQGLNADSPAIDKGNPEGCKDLEGATLTRDQRNFFRPVNVTGQPTAICDIGAVEVGLSNLRVVKTDSTDDTPVNVGSDFTYTITITNEGPDFAPDVTLSDPLPSQVNFVGPITTSAGTCSNAGQTINCELGDVDVGTTVTVSFPVTAVSASNTVVNTVTVTTSTKDFESGGTFTATVTTAVIGGGVIEGSGCIIHAGPVGENAWQMLLPMALCLAAVFATRLGRRSQE